VREHALPALAATLAWGIIAATDNAFDYYGPFTQFVAFLTGGALVAARAGAAPVLAPVALPESHPVAEGPAGENLTSQGRAP
jgi:hypothetical protein